MLLRDETPCHDALCASRLTCLRWIERYPTSDAPAHAALIAHADSLLATGADGRCINHLTAHSEAA